jgi:hypothetical protein
MGLEKEQAGVFVAACGGAGHLPAGGRQRRELRELGTAAFCGGLWLS